MVLRDYGRAVLAVMSCARVNQVACVLAPLSTNVDSHPALLTSLSTAEAHRRIGIDSKRRVIKANKRPKVLVSMYVCRS